MKISEGTLEELQQDLANAEQSINLYRYRWWAWPLVLLTGWFGAGFLGANISEYPLGTPENSNFMQKFFFPGAVVSVIIYAVLIPTFRIRSQGRMRAIRRALVLGDYQKLSSNSIDTDEPAPTAPKAGYRIFVVHGHDKSSLNEVARYLEGFALKVIILKDESSGGATVIEKLFSHDNIDFAIVLLTPDDIGGKADSGVANQRPRARQNAILELGFFLGRIGRARVCVLYVEGVEIPSDYAGVVFVRLDDHGAWKLSLAGELSRAGLEVDLNRLIQGR